jgi:hypothetical protein
VGDARPCRASADAQHPLAEDGGVDEGVAPEHVREARVSLQQLTQVLVLDEADRARRDGAHAVVQGLQLHGEEVGMSPGVWKAKIWRLPVFVSL